MNYLSANLINSSAIHAGWAHELTTVRNHFSASELALNVAIGNEAAQLPLDAWREIDAITMRVMRHDEGDAYMTDLMALARPINIGKLVYMTRQASDAGSVKRSMSGQTGAPMDKVTYTFEGTPVPIFDTAYGREWREWNTLRSENFDALADDQEAHTAALKEDIADYVLNGDANISLKGYSGYGIKTHPNATAINLGNAVGGYDIDLTSAATTAEQVENFINAGLGAVMDANYLTGRKVNLYISPEIARNWDRPYSGAGGFKEGSIRDVIAKNRRINKIVDTHKLSGNEFFGFVPDSRFIRPLVGMATNTIALPRTFPRDNYQFLVSSALGLHIPADANGRSGVFYSVEVDA